MKDHNEIAAKAAMAAYDAIQNNTDNRPTLEILNEHFHIAVEKAYRQGLNEGFGKGKRAGIRDSIHALHASENLGLSALPSDTERADQLSVSPAHASEQYACNKCGYYGATSKHEGCSYLAAAAHASEQPAHASEQREHHTYDKDGVCEVCGQNLRCHSSRC